MCCSLAVIRASTVLHSSTMGKMGYAVSMHTGTAPDAAAAAPVAAAPAAAGHAAAGPAPAGPAPAELLLLLGGEVLREAMQRSPASIICRTYAMRWHCCKLWMLTLTLLDASRAKTDRHCCIAPHTSAGMCCNNASAPAAGAAALLSGCCCCCWRCSGGSGGWEAACVSSCRSSRTTKPATCQLASSG